MSSITKIIDIKITSLDSQRGNRMISIGTKTFITCSHVPNIKVDDIIVCKTNDEKTRYFQCIHIDNNIDIYYEIGYFPKLLKNKSLEEVKDLLNGCEFSIATEEQKTTAYLEQSLCCLC